MCVDLCEYHDLGGHDHQTLSPHDHYPESSPANACLNSFCGNTDLHQLFTCNP